MLPRQGHPRHGAPGRPASEISSALAPNEPDPGTPAEPPAGSHPRVRARSRSASTDDQGLPALGPPTRHTQPPFLRFFRLGPLRAAHSDPLPQAEARPAEISPSLPSSPLHAPPRVGRRLTRIAVGSGGSISVVFVLAYDRSRGGEASLDLVLAKGGDAPIPDLLAIAGTGVRPESGYPDRMISNSDRLSSKF
jgi:hypothetical protein